MGTSDVTIQSTGVVKTHSPAETKRIARIFTNHCVPNDVVGLAGTLGAGKTCFVKGMAQGLGIEARHKVTSPTFVLHKEYEGDLTLHHFDAYRLEGAEAMTDLGCNDIFTDGGVSVIEWADHVIECLPDEHYMWFLRITGQRERELELHASGVGLHGRLRALEADLQDYM